MRKYLNRFEWALNFLGRFYCIFVQRKREREREILWGAFQQFGMVIEVSSEEILPEMHRYFAEDPEREILG